MGARKVNKDDPRHGWTWDDCWKDAVALLGSEQAVKESIVGREKRAEDEPKGDGRKDLFGEPLAPKQHKLF